MSKRRATMLRVACAVWVALATAVVGGDARAQSSASAAAVDSVLLRDGTILHGHVSAMSPRVSVTIELPTGEARTVEWANIVRASGPAFIANDAFSNATTQFDPRDWSETENVLLPAPGYVPLRVESPSRPQLVGIGLATWRDGQGSQGELFRNVCFTPCTLYVRPGVFTVHYGGQGVRTGSTAVRVNEAGETVRLHAPSTTRWGVGLAATIVGASAVAFLPWALPFETPDDTCPSGSSCANDRAHAFNGTLIAIAASGAVLAAGIAILAATEAGPIPARSAARHHGSHFALGAAPLPGGAMLAGGLAF